jgi:hypothetical protein
MTVDLLGAAIALPVPIAPWSIEDPIAPWSIAMALAPGAPMELAIGAGAIGAAPGDMAAAEGAIGAVVAAIAGGCIESLSGDGLSHAARPRTIETVSARRTKLLFMTDSFVGDALGVA